jgi:hypothetical protein
MVNYQQGKIYKIECNVTGKVYIGSTCKNTLAERLAQHVTDYKRYLKGTYHYISSFAVLQNRNYDIVLIEKYPCNSKDELHARERYWCNELECVNQRKNPGMYNLLGEKGFGKYYREKNKDTIHAKKKEYYNDNKDKKNEKHDCICGGKYTHVHKALHIRTAKHQQYLYYLKYKTIIDGLNMIKVLDKYFNTI